MQFSKTAITIPAEFSDIVSAILLDYSSGGVSVEGEDLLSQIDNWDYADESQFTGSKTIRVSGYNIASPDRLKEELDRLKSINQNFWYSIDVTLHDDKEYIDAYKEYFKPFEVGALCIVPKWETNNVKTRKTKIIIDPGLAFGTGTHQTTYMCLEMINTVDCREKTAIDVGCGSGILGFSMLVLGAKKAVLIDNDISAADAAKSNAQLNNFDGECKIKHGILEDSDISADIITANITADILCAISKDLKKHLNAGGTLILSGIIEPKQTQVEECFTALGFKILQKAAMDDWRAYKMTI